MCEDKKNQHVGKSDSKILLDSDCTKGLAGFATVVTAAFLICTCFVCGGGFYYAKIMITRHQVQAAVDLAALGASQIIFTDNPCAFSAHYAEKNGMSQISCEISLPTVHLVFIKYLSVTRFRIRIDAEATAGPEFAT